MNRVAAVLAAVLLLASGSGVTVWLLTRDRPQQLPEISAFSRGHLTRVGPYRYCDVLNLDNCRTTGTQGELPVNSRDPVQLSVPSAIARAPWRLLQVYRDPADTTMTIFRPDSRLAVTIPTVGPRGGQLTGVVVQLLTLVLDSGELQAVPHAEWSVRTDWP